MFKQLVDLTPYPFTGIGTFVWSCPLCKMHPWQKKKNFVNFVVENVKTHRSCKNNINCGHNPKCLNM
jgi:hypothetical protein